MEQNDGIVSPCIEASKVRGPTLMVRQKQINPLYQSQETKNQQKTPEDLHRQHTMENQYKLSKSWHILQPSWDKNALTHIFIQLNRHIHQGNIKKQSKRVTIWVKKKNKNYQVLYS